MKFGWLTLAHAPSPQADRNAIFAVMDQAILAEKLGFAGVWLTEHNRAQIEPMLPPSREAIADRRVQQFKQPGTCLHCHASIYVPYKQAGGGDRCANILGGN